MDLRVFRTHENVNLPKFQTKESACFDLEYNNSGKTSYKGYNENNKAFERVFANAYINIFPGERVLVPTGLIFDIPLGYSVRIHPRSGLSLGAGLMLANSEAVIDSDYIDECYILVYNGSNQMLTFNNGDRLAQAELIKLTPCRLLEAKEKPVQKTDRVGGFGSTGVKKEELDKVE